MGFFLLNLKPFKGVPAVVESDQFLEIIDYIVENWPVNCMASSEGS